MSHRSGRVSVITPTFNGIEFIDACVGNVIEQGEDVLEHIIVDGGSTDGTVERVEALMRDHQHLRLIRGPDQGQSDAMNKGTRAGRGDFIGILNVDDAYRDGAVKAAVRLLDALSGTAVVVGDCRVIDENGQLNFWNRPTNLRPEALLLGWKYAQFPCNPSAYFYHREVHDLVGGYDVADHFAMDFDFIIKCARKVAMQYVPEHWGDFRLAPGCKTYQDERGPERVAAIIAQNMVDIGRIGRMRVRLMKARVDFHRFRHRSAPRRLEVQIGQ